MTIDVDVGEVQSGIPVRLRAMGAAVRVSQLDTADYLVGEEIGVERKAIPDLHDSIHNRRLWSQLRKSRSNLRRVYLVVEGRKLDAGAIAPAGVRGVLLEIGDRGITVIRTTDTTDTAEWILRIAIRAQRRGSAPKPRPRRYRVVTTPADIVAGVPGIGPRTAQRLVARFGSIQGIAGATPDDLCDVHGIGPKLASRIHVALTRT